MLPQRPVRLDVPRVDVRKILANDPAKRLPIDIIFRESAGGAATETLSFKAAYCVFYGEQFHAGDAQDGSYTADVHLSGRGLARFTLWKHCRAPVAPDDWARSRGRRGAVARAAPAALLGPAAYLHCPPTPPR